MVYRDSLDDVDSDHTTPVSPHSPTSHGVSDESPGSSVSSLCENEPQMIARVDAEVPIKQILKLYCELSDLPSLTPQPLVNRLFDDLVSSCLHPFNEMTADAVLGDARIEKIVPRLRQICSDGECELERYWAGKIAEDAERAVIAPDCEWNITCIYEMVLTS
jgi:hypothetical protein